MNRWQIISAFGLLWVSVAAGAVERTALVIGNAAYRGESVLQNTVNDARDMSRILQRLGYTVTTLENADNRTLRRGINDYLERIRGNGGVAVLYYSGHGVQDSQRNNYLLPVDAEVRQESHIRADGVGLNPILEQLGQRPDGAVSLVILDACRNNPFSGGVKGVEKGLARVSAPPGGTLVLYAASPGQTADDNQQGRNGLFTRYLLEHLPKAGLDIEEAFRDVAVAVKQASGNRQIPYKEGNLLGRYSLAGEASSAVSVPAPTPVSPSAVPTPAVDHDLIAWQSAEKCGKAACFQAYLADHPKGRYARMAQAQLEPEPEPTPTPAPTPVEKPQRSSKDPTMVAIPAGCFQMGSPASEKVGKNEVTVGEFKRFVEATNHRTDAEQNVGGEKGCNMWSDKDGKWAYRDGTHWRKPGYTQKDNYPVVCVSWNDAVAYTAWLKQETGNDYRLPTEAEWEYAARAGTTTARYWGNNANEACRYANVADRAKSPGGLVWTEKHECSDGYWYAAPVGKYRANAWQLNDMLGNVWEWTCSLYDKDYGGSEKECNFNDTIGLRALRGGSWYYGPARVRSAYRAWSTPTSRLYIAGFRLARSL